jgi:hypothetical protein
MGGAKRLMTRLLQMLVSFHVKNMYPSINIRPAAAPPHSPVGTTAAHAAAGVDAMGTVSALRGMPANMASRGPPFLPAPSVPSPWRAQRRQRRARQQRRASRRYRTVRRLQRAATKAQRVSDLPLKGA